MATQDSPLDRLWKEYSTVFRDFDDLTLARWLAQTLGQLEGRAWRLSHPLLGAYRLAAQLAHDRQIWFKRLANPPPAYDSATCCRAPLLPLFTRDVLETGLVCQHCGETCVALEDLTPELQAAIQVWANRYAPLHAVAHVEGTEREKYGDYDAEYDHAAEQVEELLRSAGRDLAPRLLEHFPAIIWEDQDECLEVRPEDISV
jgi:hypothetical protein